MQYMFSESWKDSKVLTTTEVCNIFLHFSWYPVGSLKGLGLLNISELFSYNDLMKAFDYIDNTQASTEIPALRNDYDWLNYNGDYTHYLEFCKTPCGERKTYFSYTERVFEYIRKFAKYYPDGEIAQITGISRTAVYNYNPYKYTENDNRYLFSYKPPLEEFDQSRYDKEGLENYLVSYVKNKL